MKLSTMGRYALRLMVVVARESKSDGTPVKLFEVAQQTSISKNYLERVAMHLKNGGLLKSVSGKKGGYFLGKPPESITMKDIIEVAIGPINIVDCILYPGACDLVEDVCMCECRDVFQLVNKQIAHTFDSFTLAELAWRKADENIDRKVMFA